jgi:hypothetical protein
LRLICLTFNSRFTHGFIHRAAGSTRG